jgi:hypothetical protein
MGAHNFTTWSHGKTPLEAFNRACEEATHEYGHNGYNGTISTNGDFFEVKLPVGSKLKHTDLEELSWELESGGPPTDPGIKRKFDHEWDRVYHQRRRELFKLWTSLTPTERAAVEQASRFEKWGPCVCVEITGKEAAAYKQRAAAYWTITYCTNGVKKTKRLPNGTKVYKFWGLASS